MLGASGVALVLALSGVGQLPKSDPTNLRRVDRLVFLLHDASGFFPMGLRKPIPERCFTSDLLQVAYEPDLRVVQAALARFAEERLDSWKMCVYEFLLPLVFVPPRDEGPRGSHYGWYKVVNGRLKAPHDIVYGAFAGATRPLLPWFDEWSKTQPRQDLTPFMSQIDAPSASLDGGKPKSGPVGVPGYSLFCGEDESGKRYFFSLPKRFALRHSRTRDEYDFASAEGETLCVAFVVEGTPSLQKASEAALRAIPASQRIEQPGGATVTHKVERARYAGTAHRWIGRGNWNRSRSTGAIDLRSNRAQECVDAEVVRIASSFFCDGMPQSVNGLAERFPSGVTLLKPPRELKTKKL